MQVSRNQTKTLLGIETDSFVVVVSIYLSRNQTKTLLGIETEFNRSPQDLYFRRNQTKTLLGIETSQPGAALCTRAAIKLKPY